MVLARQGRRETKRHSIDSFSFPHYMYISCGCRSSILYALAVTWRAIKQTRRTCNSGVTFCRRDDLWCIWENNGALKTISTSVLKTLLITLLWKMKSTKIRPMCRRTWDLLRLPRLLSKKKKVLISSRCKMTNRRTQVLTRPVDINVSISSSLNWVLVKILFWQWRKI